MLAERRYSGWSVILDSTSLAEGARRKERDGLPLTGHGFRADTRRWWSPPPEALRLRLGQPEGLPFTQWKKKGSFTECSHMPSTLLGTRD